jgi:hypothetical protein
VKTAVGPDDTYLLPGSERVLVKEPFVYRAWKWAIQQLTGRRSGDQLERLDTVDWDLLVILDACRADVLRSVAEWPVPAATSPASCTPEWLRCVADAQMFEDAHIVTANPQYDDIDLGAAAVESYWESHWDDARQTVLPEPVLDRVDDLLADGTRRIVAHLQQPHWPYVATLDGLWYLACEDLGPWHVEGSDDLIESVQVAQARGRIDASRAEMAYRSSIHSVWDTLEPYLAAWMDRSHRVVVTADHGETFGATRDFRFYEHPCMCHVRPLTEVPFVKFIGTEPDAMAGSAVEDRLKALGYTE